ncbi:MAG: endonuclease/exonuclease/phosphatase family protein [Candidatus Limnocylindrales bacterium]
MRILSWNIYRGGRDGDRLDRLELVIDLINHLRPDAVLLQEARDFDRDQASLARDCARRLSMSCLLAIAPTGYHLAAYTKPGQVDMAWTQNEPFFHASLHLVFDQAVGAGIHVVSVHLCAGDPNKRAVEIAHLVEALDPSSLALLVGDFNAPDPDQDAAAVARLEPRMRTRFVGADGLPDRRVLDALRDHGYLDLARLTGDIAPTYSTRRDGSEPYEALRLDRAYVSEVTMALAPTVKVLREPEMDRISDHYPLLITLADARLGNA